MLRSPLEHNRHAEGWPLERLLRPIRVERNLVMRSPDKRSDIRVPAPHAGLMSPVTRAAKASRLVQIGVDAGAFAGWNMWTR